MAAFGFLGLLMTRKVLGSLSKVSHYSTKPTKMITEQENKFWNDYENIFLHKVFEGHL